MIETALKGLSYLIILKIFSKILDFVLNVLIIRDIDPEIYGLTMHFTLLFNLCIYYVRNCLKTSYLKRTVTAEDGEDKIALNELVAESARNMMVLGVYFTAVFSTMMGGIWIYLYGKLNPGYPLAILFYCSAVSIESMNEPIIVRALLNFEYEKVAKAEGFGVFFKAIFLYIFMEFTSMNHLVCFGLAQMLSSSIIVAVSYSISLSYVLVPRIITVGDRKNGDRGFYIQKDMKNIGYQMTFITILKCILTEIERIILINFGKDSKSSAEYTLVSNLGSMIPRYIYSPTEEICFNLFAKMNTRSDDNPSIDVDSQFRIINKIYKLINILGLFLLTFGISFSHSLINFLYGQKWTYPESIQAMQMYCVLVYVAGINGITEAYLYSTVKENDLKVFRYLITLNTTIYILLCLVLVKYNAVGLILANILSMLIRITIGLLYMRKNMPKDKSVAWFVISSLPNKYSVLSFVLTYLASRSLLSHFSYMSSRNLLVLGAGLAGINLLTVYRFHKEDVMELLSQKKKIA